MALCLYILFDRKLPSEAALAQSFQQLGFPLAFDGGADLLAPHPHYLPMRLRGEESGFELSIADGREDVEDIAGEEIDCRFTGVARVSWTGGAEEGAAAACFAAAFAKLVDGLVLQSYGEVELTPDRAIAVARRDLDATAERFRRPGTHPAEIRRYLEPLLEQRRDLVLIGRLLLVRPVRHLLRGALLDATGDRFELRVGPYITPLYHSSPDSIGYVGHSYHQEYKVWRRNFVPLLIDMLGEEIFEPLGRITTIADFAPGCLHEMSGLLQSGRILTSSDFIVRRRSEAHLAREALDRARITALVLAGEVDRAAAYAEQRNQEAEAQKGVASPARMHFSRLVKDLAATCAEYHAREADLIKRMKLDHIWEQTPFPVEVQASERNTTAEPLFAITPWPAPPPGLRQEGPTQPGEVRFAEDYFWRGETLMLRAALTPEQAAERHRALEDYVLVVRLPDGRLLILSHWTGFDRNDPDGPPRGTLDATFHVRLHGGTERVVASTSSTYLWREYPDLTQIFDIRIYRASEEIWLGYFLLHEGRRDIYDWRSGEQVYTSSALTEAERDLCMFPKPGCGEYAIFIERIEALLRLSDQPAPPESCSCVDESAPTSMEIDVAFHGNLPGKAALTQMFEQLGFPLSFQHSSRRLTQHDGSLPMRLRGKEVEVEFDTWDLRGVFETFFGKESVPHLAYSASFGWSNEDERTVAICLAAALAKLKDGLVMGLQPDRKLTADEAIASAREALEVVEDSGN